MGVDCRILLPDNVRVSDVANVIGIAAGLKSEKRHFQSGDGWSAHVKGAAVVSCSCSSLASCADINIIGDLIDGESNHHVLYHFEPEDGGRLMIPQSTAFWIAVGRKLVDFFGGSLTYQDCDGDDYSRPAKSREENAPTDGKPWYDFQQRLLDLEPISEAELEDAEQHAAYHRARD